MQTQQGVPGTGYETKYSAQQGFAQTAQTPPSSGPGYGVTSGGSGGFGDVLNRYKLEQTIRQLHGIHSSDPRATFAGASFSGV